MWRSIQDIENEIIGQILISEICFDVCATIPTLPGRGSDFLPFYYNLNFSKGIISLHSLLLSNLSNELSLKNYLKQYKKDFPKGNIANFSKKIKSISESFKNTLPLSLRHKVFAHTDQGFKHTDFTNAYTTPKLVKEYVLIIQELKKTFFEFAEHAQHDYPHDRILKQSKLIIKKIVKESSQNYKL